MAHADAFKHTHRHSLGRQHRTKLEDVEEGGHQEADVERLGHGAPQEALDAAL
jgi:hypothetical protein